MHLTKLGIKVNRYSGVLFYNALLTFILNGIILSIYGKDIRFLFKTRAI